MRKFKLVTDSACDLCYEMVNEMDIGYIGLVCEIEENEIVEDCGRSLSYKEFYDSLRNKALPKTSQVNPNRFYEFFEGYLKEGYDILYVGFSSKLSGTYNSASIARESLLEKYEDSKIVLIDSKSGSCGEGLIVYRAAKLRDEGRSLDETASRLEEYVKKLHSYFTVDDLNHLKRGGRISSVGAAFGTMFNISPILYATDEGTLEVIGRTRGHKKTLKELIKKIEENMGKDAPEEVFISHGDDEKSCEILKALVKERYPSAKIVTNYMGLVVGSHTGAGSCAVFFIEK